ELIARATDVAAAAGHRPYPIAEVALASCGGWPTDILAGPTRRADSCAAGGDIHAIEGGRGHGPCRARIGDEAHLHRAAQVAHRPAGARNERPVHPVG